MLADATKICLPFSVDEYLVNLFKGIGNEQKKHLKFENGGSRGKSGKFYVL